MSHSLPLSSIHRSPRRRALQVGALGGLGLAGIDLRSLKASVPRNHERAKSCVFIFLFGGPSHIDLWDMKPHAPAEIRGEFQPIATSTPGLSLCEHLPLLSRQTHNLCLVRSMTHHMNVHGPACSEVYSGREYFGPPVTDQALPEDWPSMAALAMRYGPTVNNLPPSIVLPWYTQFVGQDRRIAGQTGGRMGEQWNPFLVSGELTSNDFDVHELRLPGEVPLDRLQRRQQLRTQLLDESFLATHGEIERFADLQRSACQLVEQNHATDAFAIHHESEETRERYGRTRFGQSLLLARRLVEHEVPLVTVNWDDESASDKVSPHWDTHHNAFSKLKDDLCPLFDRAFSTFIADLDDRGLLESTLVVALGEFGRTPHIGLVTQNGMTEKTGRDHWPHAFTALVAGGGVSGGMTYGETNGDGGYVTDRPLGPADLSATIFHHLGIDPQTLYFDEFQQAERQLSEGQVVDFSA